MEDYSYAWGESHVGFYLMANFNLSDDGNL